MQGIQAFLKNGASLHTHEQIKKICEPLFKLFSLNFFRYLRLYPDGSRIHLCTEPRWTEHFYKNNFFNIAWHDSKQINLSTNSKILWDERATRNDNIVGITARTVFNIHHGFSIVRSNFNYYEIFDFATEEKNLQVNDNYIAHLEIFEHFIFYFRDKAYYIIKDAEKYKFKPENLNNINVKNEVSTNFQFNNFLDQTKINRYFLNVSQGDNYLTKKELECIYWCAKGKSAEEIGIIISAAKRTVEIHLENIKQKFNCNKLCQLIKIITDAGILNIYRPQ